MLTEKYDFRITDQMTIPLRPHWIANDSYREKCKMLVLNRSKGEIHKVDFSKLTDYIKEGDVICFNDSTIINHMFICKTRQNRLIKIVLEGFLPNNRVIISGLLKERLNANDVFYLVDNPECCSGSVWKVVTSTMSSNVHPAAVSVAFRFSKASLTCF